MKYLQGVISAEAVYKTISTGLPEECQACPASNARLERIARALTVGSLEYNPYLDLEQLDEIVKDPSVAGFRCCKESEA